MYIYSYIHTDLSSLVMLRLETYTIAAADIYIPIPLVRAREDLLVSLLYIYILDAERGKRRPESISVYNAYNNSISATFFLSHPRLHVYYIHDTMYSYLHRERERVREKGSSGACEKRV